MITKLEPDLFKKLTGLSVEDFHLLVSLGVFNSTHMNQAVFAFRRYEDSSLSYTGIDSHRTSVDTGCTTLSWPSTPSLECGLPARLLSGKVWRQRRNRLNESPNVG